MKTFDMHKWRAEYLLNENTASKKENKSIKEVETRLSDDELFNRAKASGVSYNQDNDTTSSFGGKKVDYSTIELDGVDSRDYPDFSDAFIASAQFEDGTELTDDELDTLQDELADEIGDMAYQSLLEGLSDREKQLKEQVLKALR